nr:class I SAM-dependent methyltransferase [Luteithermobacter gelatinilyticus]
MVNFKDHFSRQSGAYRQYRPAYPPELFAYLAGLVTIKERAWDCGCGTGQAARGLAEHFRKVMATDGSAEQIRHAAGPDNIEFRVARAEQSGLDSDSVDLVTVAQALHWFDLEAFYAEVKRVVKPDGVIAVWSYGLLGVFAELDREILRLYEDILGAYWPEERRLVEEGYASLPFPFQEEADIPGFAMRARWTFDQLMGYFSSWSAVQRYQEKAGHSPLALIEEDMRRVWGNVSQARNISWPLKLRIGRLS